MKVSWPLSAYIAVTRKNRMCQSTGWSSDADPKYMCRWVHLTPVSGEKILYNCWANTWTGGSSNSNGILFLVGGVKELWIKEFHWLKRHTLAQFLPALLDLCLVGRRGEVTGVDGEAWPWYWRQILKLDLDSCALFFIKSSVHMTLPSTPRRPALSLPATSQGPLKGFCPPALFLPSRGTLISLGEAQGQ